MNARSMLLGTLVVVATVSTSLLIAGPLTPPAGPVAGTYKTLGEIEPRIAVNATNTPGDATSVYRITAPGSYYLAGNIAGVSAKHAIAIAASGVSLDLCGFEIAGVAGSLDGISATVAGLSNIAITNGLVRSFAGDGVDLVNASGVRVSDLTASGNTGEGIATGDNAVATRCVGRSNGVSGVRVANGSTITDCSASGNSNRGFLTGAGCSISRCSSASNGAYGFVVANSTISECGAYNNVAAGIFSAGNATIVRCTVRGSGGDGIQVGEGCLIQECVSRGNSGDGIEVLSDCRVAGNLCDDNGGSTSAGIHVTGNRNRIEGNRVAGSLRGLEIGASGNFVSGNTVVQNTSNYVVVGDNAMEILLGEIPQTINFPCKITLAGSLRGASGSSGISINDADVDIDLNGHTLFGVAGAQTGIFYNGAAHSLTIRNGVVRDWSLSGINLLNASARIENVSLINNAQAGLAVGYGSSISRCVARSNTGIGFTDFGGTTYSSCEAYGNGSDGFFFGSGSTAEACASSSNGRYGFYTFQGNSVQRCSAYLNASSGIWVQAGCTIVGNTCHNNSAALGSSGAGIEGQGNDGAGARIEGNSVTDNKYGILINGAGFLVIRNSARGNTLANYSITAGNAAAQVITGSFGFVSTDPNANIGF